MIYLPRATFIDFGIEIRILLLVLIFGDEWFWTLMRGKSAIKLWTNSREPPAVFVAKTPWKGSRKRNVSQGVLLMHLVTTILDNDYYKRNVIYQ